PPPCALECPFVGLRTRVAEEDTLCKGVIGQPPGQLRPRASLEEIGRVDDAAIERLADRGGEVLIAVSEGVHRNAAREVEVALAIFGDQRGALTGNEYRFG